MVMMDQYDLGVHGVDIQIMRFNNCIQTVACILDTLDICVPGLRDCAHVVNCIADLVFTATVTCMVTQIYHEIKVRDAGAMATSTAYAAEPTEATPMAPSAPEKMER